VETGNEIVENDSLVKVECESLNEKEDNDL